MNDKCCKNCANKCNPLWNRPDDIFMCLISKKPVHSTHMCEDWKENKND
jgi:hypothetical protein